MSPSGVGVSVGRVGEAACFFPVMWGNDYSICRDSGSALVLPHHKILGGLQEVEDQDQDVHAHHHLFFEAATVTDLWGG